MSTTPRTDANRPTTELQCPFCAMSRDWRKNGAENPYTPVFPFGEPEVPVFLTDTKTILVCKNHAGTIRRVTSESSKRIHIVPSAGYWFEGSRAAQRNGKSAEAVSHMENAYNHVENALDAARSERTTLTARLAEVERERDGWNKDAKTWEAQVYIERDKRDTLAADNAQLTKERDEALAAGGFCEKHKPSGGVRNCLICGCIKLSHAIDRIDYAMGPKNEMEVSDYCVHQNEEAVIAKVVTLAAENERLKEDKLRLDWLEATYTSIGFNVENSMWGVDFEAPYKEKIRGAIDAAMKNNNPSPKPSPVPAIGNEGTTESKTPWVDMSREIAIQKLEAQLADEHRAKNVALRDRDELKRRIEELEKEVVTTEQNYCVKCGEELRYCGKQDPITHIPAIECRLCQMLDEAASLRAELATLKAEIVKKDASLAEVIQLLGECSHSVSFNTALYKDARDAIDRGHAALSPTAPKGDEK